MALASAMTLALAPPALALATAGAQGGLRTAADRPNAPLHSDTTTTTPTTTTTTPTTTPTTPTTPTTTPTTPTQPSTTPTTTATPYTQPTTVPYTPPTTTQATTPAAPLTTTTPAPPPVVQKPKPAFHYAPPRVRLTDLGVAQRGAAASLARGAGAADPAPTTHRTRMIVLIATGFGLLLALAAASVLIVRQRRPAALPRRFEVDRERLTARRDFFRVNGDRIRVAFDERGADLLILGLGLAAAVALGALVAS